MDGDGVLIEPNWRTPNNVVVVINRTVTVSVTSSFVLLSTFAGNFSSDAYSLGSDNKSFRINVGTYRLTRILPV